MNPALVGGIVGAITAGTITFLIEYAAKPRLEARKERILLAHRQKRELRKSLEDLESRIIGYRIMCENGSLPRRPEIESTYDLANVALSQLRDTRDAYAKSLFDNCERSLGLARAAFINSMLILDHSVERPAATANKLCDRLAKAHEQLGVAIEMTDLARWKFWQRNSTSASVPRIGELRFPED